MKRTLFAATMILFLFSACKKEENNPTPNPTPSETGADFYPLKKGNYWIYEQYRKNAGESDFKATGKLDSVYVAGDTTFAGKACKIVKVPYFNGKYIDQYRRVDGDKIYNNDAVIFSSSNFSTPIFEYLSYHDATTKKDTNQFIQTRMKKVNGIVVPKGTFDTYAAEVYSYWGKTAQRPAFSNNFGTRYFVKGIGVVREIVGAEDYTNPNPPFVIERRLLRYKFQ